MECLLGLDYVNPNQEIPNPLEARQEILGANTFRNDSESKNRSKSQLKIAADKTEREARRILGDDNIFVLACCLEYGAIVNLGLADRLQADSGLLAHIDLKVRQALQNVLERIRSDYEKRMTDEVANSISRLVECLLEDQRLWLFKFDNHFTSDFDLYRCQLRTEVKRGKKDANSEASAFVRSGFFRTNSVGYLFLEPELFIQFPSLVTNWVSRLPPEALQGRGKIELMHDIQSLADDYIQEIKFATSIAIITNSIQLLGSRNVVEAVRLTEERYTKVIFELLGKSVSADFVDQLRQRLSELEFRTCGVPGVLSANRLPAHLALSESQMKDISKTIAEEYDKLEALAKDIQQEIVNHLGNSLEPDDEATWNAIFGESTWKPNPMPYFILRKPEKF